jgi:chemotaxis protein MotB
MARRHKHEEHVNHERWAIPYGDLVTLLLAFFVVMYSISSVNEGKYRVLSDSLMSAFRQPTKSIEPIQIGEQSRALPKSQVNLVKRPSFIDLPKVIETDADKDMDDRRSAFPTLGSLVGSDKVAEIGRIAEEISRSLKALMDQGLVTVHFNELWLEVEIKDSILFPSGSAQLQSGAVPVLKQIAGILRDAANPVRVEGFTDNVPISTLLYPSNWELSTVRAASVVRLFAREGIAPERMSALGYGEFRPIATNDTPAGRAQNRRVVLVVLADENLSFLLDGGLRDRSRSVPMPVDTRTAGDDPPASADPDPAAAVTPAITAPPVAETPSELLLPQGGPILADTATVAPFIAPITPIDFGGPLIRPPSPLSR